LAQRQKQIDYGKKTVGYERYMSMVPKDKRESGQPITPRKDQRCSKRSWDGQVRKWRRDLHRWDPEDEKELERWTRLVREKFGDDIEEEVDEESPPFGQANAKPVEVPLVNRTLVF
jgi:hypothetical protein